MDDEQIISIKAAGDYELDVLAVPFGGPNQGRDSDGERFTAQTDTMREQFPSVPVFHYHGMDGEQNPVADPEPIGVAKYDHTDTQGHWYRVVLDKASAIAKKLWDAARAGTARASSGAISHLVRKMADGTITKWPLAELSLMDAAAGMLPANAYAVALPVAKSHYKAAGMSMPQGAKMDLTAMITEMLTAAGITPTPELIQKLIDDMGAAPAAQPDPQKGGDNMNAEIQAAVEKVLAEREAAAQKKSAETEEAVKAARAQLEKEAAEANRLPNIKQAPAQAKFGETWKYDNLTPGDAALVIEMCSQSKSGVKASPALYQALALKMANDTGPDAPANKMAIKAAGIKLEADSVNYVTNTSYGAEWIGTAYSNELWRSIRAASGIANRIPSFELPQGFSSTYFPLESTDPVWYKVAETVDLALSTTAVPLATVPSNALGTAQKQITVGKMGARVTWTGEQDEDSFIAMAPQIREQLGISGAEMMDYVVINGDTDATNATNINAIDTTPAATALYLLTNGFRKSPLITTTANSRSAGGSLDITDYLETVKLMGASGLNSLDVTKVSFLVDLNTYWKSLGLPEVLTRDVNGQATVENGKLSRVFGYEVVPSGFVQGGGAYGSAKRMSNSAGKIDADTDANNLYGCILAVRWDQWKLAFKRRMTIEMTRFANSDSNELVAMSRWGLGQRDTEASAISYYVGV